MIYIYHSRKLLKNLKMSNKIFTYPLFIIGISLLILGVRWMVVDKPWMLDEVANIDRLKMNFEELFKPEINRNLPGYLRQIYRFFGFWVIIIGLFISMFTSPNIVLSKSIRLRLLFVMGVMMILGTILGYALIPSSHFITLIWIMNALYLLSIYGHIKLNE